jgi:hypothetical protein
MTITSAMACPVCGAITRLSNGLISYGHECALRPGDVLDSSHPVLGDGWIEWHGGDCPAPGARVGVALRGASEYVTTNADSLSWRHTGGSGDVVRYRVLGKPDASPDKSALTTQVEGDHYKKHKIQPLEYIHANGIPFAEGCVIKYVTRWRDKGGIKDLEKAKHFIELLIELEGQA